MYSSHQGLITFLCLFFDKNNIIWSVCLNIVSLMSYVSIVRNDFSFKISTFENRNGNSISYHKAF